MFEARLAQGSVLKKLVDAVKELVAEANFDVSSEGITLQAMDHAHVCLVAFALGSDDFQHYRCDRPQSMGINIANLSKVLKCAGNDDVITLKADDHGDTLTLMFESQKQDRVSDFDLKLLSIEAEQLGIPDQNYSAQVVMPSSEYQRICRDLGSIGDTVLIAATKDGCRFSTSGDVGTANITMRHSPTEQENAEDSITVEIEDPVAETFALRYLGNFAKACPLSSQVKISLPKESPVEVEFRMSEHSNIRYFLAPKIQDEDAADNEEA